MHAKLQICLPNILGQDCKKETLGEDAATEAYNGVREAGLAFQACRSLIPQNLWPPNSRTVDFHTQPFSPWLQLCKCLLPGGHLCPLWAKVPSSPNMVLEGNIKCNLWKQNIRKLWHESFKPIKRPRGLQVRHWKCLQSQVMWKVNILKLEKVLPWVLQKQSSGDLHWFHPG